MPSLRNCRALGSRGLALKAPASRLTGALLRRFCFAKTFENARDVPGGAVPRAYAFPFSGHMPGDAAIGRQASFEMAATVERDRDIT